MTENTHFAHDTPHPKRNFYVYVKWFVLFASYSFLIYKLITFEHYSSVSLWWKNVSVSSFVWLAGGVLLLPLNWFLESKKWQILIFYTEKLNLRETVSAVFAGITTGFFTPNRVGEMAGRILFLKPSNRKAGITLSVLNSISQNIVMALFGIPAFVAFLFFKKEEFTTGIIQYLILIVLVLVSLLTVFYFLRRISGKDGGGKLVDKFRMYTDCLSDFTRSDIFVIMLLTIFRYIVFCSQFYLMLHFFEVNISFLQALFAIPATYLLVTFTPSLAFSEAAIRGSYAVLVIGAIFPGDVQIILASVGIWLVNFVIPMLAGSLLLLKYKY